MIIINILEGLYRSPVPLQGEVGPSIAFFFFGHSGSLFPTDLVFSNLLGSYYFTLLTPIPLCPSVFSSTCAWKCLHFAHEHNGINSFISLATIHYNLFAVKFYALRNFIVCTVHLI